MITGVLHGMFAISQPLLVLIIKNNIIFDYSFILLMYFTLLHWTFLNGECIVTYNYKKNKHPEYIAGQNLHNDEMSMEMNNYKHIIRLIIIFTNILLMYSLYTLFNRNNILPIISYSFLILYEIYYYGLYFFNDHYKNPSFLLFQKIIKALILLWGIIFFIN